MATMLVALVPSARLTATCKARQDGAFLGHDAVEAALVPPRFQLHVGPRGLARGLRHDREHWLREHHRRAVGPLRPGSDHRALLRDPGTVLVVRRPCRCRARTAGHGQGRALPLHPRDLRRFAVRPHADDGTRHRLLRRERQARRHRRDRRAAGLRRHPVQNRRGSPVSGTGRRREEHD